MKWAARQSSHELVRLNERGQPEWLRTIERLHRYTDCSSKICWISAVVSTGNPSSSRRFCYQGPLQPSLLELSPLAPARIYCKILWFRSADHSNLNVGPLLLAGISSPSHHEDNSSLMDVLWIHPAVLSNKGAKQFRKTGMLKHLGRNGNRLRKIAHNDQLAI